MIEKGFFRQKARRGAAVLKTRTPLGMTGVFFVQEITQEHRQECLCHLFWLGSDCGAPVFWGNVFGVAGEEPVVAVQIQGGVLEFAVFGFV